MSRLDAHCRGDPRMQLEGPTAAGLMYSDTGGDGPVVVLLHGVLMNGTLWDTVVEGLRDRYRYILPELPFGANTTPMPDDADISLPASVPPPTGADYPDVVAAPFIGVAAAEDLLEAAACF